MRLQDYVNYSLVSIIESFQELKLIKIRIRGCGWEFQTLLNVQNGLSSFYLFDCRADLHWVDV
jgi:hypothetical protein